MTGAKSLFRFLSPAVIVMSVVSLVATIGVRPSTLTIYTRFPAAFLIPLAVVSSLIGMLVFSRKGSDGNAFLCSCGYLLSMLVGAALGLYPVLLPSSTDPAHDITIARALAGSYSASVGLIWWVFGIALAIGYFVFIYRMFAGKVTEELEGHEH
jgi:cytochrome d ubiquinol oxidase subunit II